MSDQALPGRLGPRSVCTQKTPAACARRQQDFAEHMADFLAAARVRQVRTGVPTRWSSCRAAACITCAVLTLPLGQVLMLASADAALRGDGQLATPGVRFCASGDAAGAAAAHELGFRELEVRLLSEHAERLRNYRLHPHPCDAAPGGRWRRGVGAAALAALARARGARRAGPASGLARQRGRQHRGRADACDGGRAHAREAAWRLRGRAAQRHGWRAGVGDAALVGHGPVRHRKGRILTCCVTPLGLAMHAKHWRPWGLCACATGCWHLLGSKGDSHGFEAAASRPVSKF